MRIMIIGETKSIVARLDKFKARVEAGLRAAVEDWGAGTVGHIKESRLSGPRSGRILGVVTGRLRSSIRHRVREDSGRLEVTFGTDVPYARIHEQGGTIPARLITPKKAGGVLSFMMGNRRVFAKSVRHPGSVIPRRPFLRPGVEDMLPKFRASISAFLSRAARGE